MATSSPRKRSFADADLDALSGLEKMVQTQLRPIPDILQTQLPSPQSSDSSKQNHEIDRHASPAPSNSTLSTVGASPVKPPGSNASNGNPPKRQKLSFAGKETLRVQKEEEKRQKADEKARKDEEKQIRDRQRAEEKTQKEEKRLAMLVEKEQKRKAKEEQDRAKEEEKRLKEEEKNKKERSQLRLNAFFKQPALSQRDSRESPVQDSTTPAGSRRGSVSSVHCPETTSRDRSVSATPQKAFPDYGNSFPPFFLQSHTALAPWNRFGRDEKGLDHARSKLDECLGPGKAELPERKPQDLAPRLAGLLHVRPSHRRHLRQPLPTVKDIVGRIQDTSYNPVDHAASTSQNSKATQTPFDLLTSIPMKSLKFVEDVRPPYIGTCTKLPPGVTAAKLGRKPFGRTVPLLDYDYDSEAEWEAPGEGEDLGSEGEDDLEEDDDDDDMNDFVVDEGGAEVKKRIPMNINVEHTSTGVCWEDRCGKSMTAIGGVDPIMDMNQYRLEMVHDTPSFPIDPHSTAYWETETEVPSSTTSLMNPPRISLTVINRENQQLPYPALVSNSELKTIVGSGKLSSNRATKPVTVKKFIAPELLDEFKKAVNGSDSTKLGIIEELKKKFPKQSKGALSDTLVTMAERIGPREGDKRWVIKSEYRASAA